MSKVLPVFIGASIICLASATSAAEPLTLSSNITSNVRTSTAIILSDEQADTITASGPPTENDLWRLSKAIISEEHNMKQTIHFLEANETFIEAREEIGKLVRREGNWFKNPGFRLPIDVIALVDRLIRLGHEEKESKPPKSQSLSPVSISVPASTSTIPLQIQGTTSSTPPTPEPTRSRRLSGYTSQVQAGQIGEVP